MTTPLVYYSKPDCPLCEKSRPVAEALAERHGWPLEHIDIFSDPELMARYAEKIPVLVRGEVELGWGRLSERALERAVRRLEG